MSWLGIVFFLSCCSTSINQKAAVRQTQKWEQRMDGRKTGKTDPVCQMIHLLSQLCLAQPTADVRMKTRTAAKTCALLWLQLAKLQLSKSLARKCFSLNVLKHAWWLNNIVAVVQGSTFGPSLWLNWNCMTVNTMLFFFCMFLHFECSYF